jgi:hypothetical protein
MDRWNFGNTRVPFRSKEQEMAIKTVFMPGLERLSIEMNI